MEEGQDNKVYLHITAASPFVYIGPEGFETDSVEVFGAAVPWLPEQRDHLMMIFDKKEGAFLSSLTVPEGIFDNWYNFIVDNIGNIYISANFYGDSITIRDTIFKNNFLINNPNSSEISLRSGLLKFSSDGDLLWGYYPLGNYSYNATYELRLFDEKLYVLSGMAGENITIGDSVLSGGNEGGSRKFLFRISINGKDKEILYHASAPLIGIIDLKVINEDTLVMIPYIGPQDWIYDYQWNPDDGFGLLKVDFSEKLVSNNTVTISNPPEVIIYPNPVSAGSILTLEFNDNVNVKSLAIYDINGRSIVDIQHKAIQTIKIPDVPSGQYYVKCRLESGVFFKPFIVQ
jgi:hypothetical protein